MTVPYFSSHLLFIYEEIGLTYSSCAPGKLISMSGIVFGD